MKQASKKEDTKQHILDEALRLFSQSGYDACLLYTSPSPRD